MRLGGISQYGSGCNGGKGNESGRKPHYAVCCECSCKESFKGVFKAVGQREKKWCAW